MTDTKADSLSKSISSHLENMPEADERGVASAQDQKDLKHVPEEDVNNPQVCWMIFTDLPAKTSLILTPSLRTGH